MILGNSKRKLYISGYGISFVLVRYYAFVTDARGDFGGFPVPAVILTPSPMRDLVFLCGANK